MARRIPDLPDLDGDVSQLVEQMLFAWLLDAARMTDEPEHVAAIVAGATDGLARFMWEVRKPGVTPRVIGARLATVIAEALEASLRGGADG